jgi:hypothetical protein
MVFRLVVGNWVTPNTACSIAQMAAKRAPRWADERAGYLNALTADLSALSALTMAAVEGWLHGRLEGLIDGCDDGCCDRCALGCSDGLTTRWLKPRLCRPSLTSDTESMRRYAQHGCVISSPQCNGEQNKQSQQMGRRRRRRGDKCP